MMKLLRYISILLLILLLTSCSNLSGIDYLQGGKQPQTTQTASELEARLMVLERSQLDIEIMLGRQAEMGAALEEIADLESQRSVLMAEGVDVDAKIAEIEEHIDSLFEAGSYERMILTGLAIDQRAVELVQQGLDPWSPTFWDEVLEKSR